MYIFNIIIGRTHFLCEIVWIIIVSDNCSWNLTVLSGYDNGGSSAAMIPDICHHMSTIASLWVSWQKVLMMYGAAGDLIFAATYNIFSMNNEHISNTSFIEKIGKEKIWKKNLWVY